MPTSPDIKRHLIELRQTPIDLRADEVKNYARAAVAYIDILEQQLREIRVFADAITTKTHF